MERWIKKGTLKRSSPEAEYFAVNSSHIDNYSNNENDTNEITPKDFRTVTKKCRKYDQSYDELLKSINFMVQTTKTVNEKATEASYLVSYRIPQCGEPYTIAESLIKPCAMEMVKCMLDEKLAKEISKIPLLNDTVANCINDLAADIQNELIFLLKSCKFALQMDESTDVAGLAILIVIVRYQHESTLLEDLLLCKSTNTYYWTTGVKIFDLLNSFLEGNKIPWENCVDICTDGAKAMSGTINGAVQRTKNIAKNCSSSHFPKDDIQLREWTKAIPRKDFLIKHRQVVCERHFHEEEILRKRIMTDKDGAAILAEAVYKIPKLKEGAIPSIFPNCPKYLSYSLKRRK